jgi:hypothetical protein
VVANGLPLASTVPTEENITAFASLLKTVDVKLDKYLDERCCSEAAYGRLKSKSDLIGYMNAWMDTNLTPQDYEANWPRYIMHLSDQDGSINEIDYVARRVKEQFSTVQGVKGDFFLWINEADVPFLNEDWNRNPSASVAYSRDGITIYRVKGA